VNRATGELEPRHPDGLLSPDEYRLLAAPALKAAAAVAASRNDPDLFHDMASMLALLAMVNTLVRCYQTGTTAAGHRDGFESIPLAVCALVFARSGLAVDEVQDCLAALPQAYRILREAGALGPQDASVEQAFAAYMAEEAGQGDRLLLDAAFAMVNAVDRWEEARSERLD